MQWINNICFGCDHFCSNNDDRLTMGCRAFPDGIPDVIGGQHTHDEVFIGDGLWKHQVGVFVYTPAKKEFNIRGRKIEIYQ